MKRAIFIIGIIACSALFFFSGLLTGYMCCEKENKANLEIKKALRTPSNCIKNMKKIIGKI